MTLIIGYKLEDYVVLTADTVRCAINPTSKEILFTEEARKIHQVFDNIAVGSSGINSCGPILNIRSIFEPHTSTTLSNIVKCTNECFNTYFNTFKKYNSTIQEPLYNIIAGIDPEYNSPFLYSFNSNNSFLEKNEDKLIVIGYKSSEVYEELLIELEKRKISNYNDYIILFAETIRKYANYTDFVGKKTLSKIFGPTCGEVYLDEDGSQLLNLPFK
jgi:20S proteasome alpha/beta subunit